jgi:hypothetical protein
VKNFAEDKVKFGDVVSDEDRNGRLSHIKTFFNLFMYQMKIT